jgi:F-type H+-transporting ATPase subunit delta
MAELATIARPYARAAFEHAQTGAARPAWSQFLATASAAVSDARVVALVGSPRVKPEQLAEFITGLSGTAAPAGAANFVQLLAANGRLDLLPFIATQFEQLRADAEGTADVTITSAIALTAEQQAKFSAALTKRLKRSVRLHCAVDPTLIGGAVVRAGDFVIDGSLRERVRQLAGAMSN